MEDVLSARRRAAHAALELLPDSGVIGLGTGATTALFIEGVAQAIASGKRLTGVATSVQSRDQAQSLGIPMLNDEGPWDIAVCVDGADEVSDDLNLIKGGGGSHLREKIVNAASRVNVIIVDELKLSRRLGERWAVPVEVATFGHAATARHLEHWGQPVLRMKNGGPWVTDGGNLIYDVHAGVIEDPARLEQELMGIPGVMETGLFVNRANVVLIGASEGVRRRDRC
jgi:ribose 5-phosphate isomerase A